MSQLTKVRYDKSTTNFDPSEEKYWLHFLANDSKDPTVRDFIRSQIRLNPQYRRDLLQQPVCERCERFAFHHKEGVQCTSCGHWSPNKTNKVKIHLAGGHYK